MQALVWKYWMERHLAASFVPTLLVRMPTVIYFIPRTLSVTDYADRQARDPEDRAPSITVGVGWAILSNRISHFLKIKGSGY